MKDKSYSKTLHLQRPSKGGLSAKRLTFCGKKFETTGPFRNPNAKLCKRCNNIAEADGLTILPSFTGTTWRTTVNPPSLVVRGRVIHDLNNPDKDVYITDEMLTEHLPLDALYREHGPQKQLTTSD